MAIYGSNKGADLPKLTIHSLTNCNVVDAVETGTPLRVPRAKWFRRLVIAIDGHSSTSKTLLTTVQVLANDKPKVPRKLTVDVSSPMRSYPLFEITPQRLEQIASEIRLPWSM